MFFGTNIEKVLELFVKEPMRGFQLREISRLTKLGLPAVKKYVSELEKKHFVRKMKGRTYDYYEADRESKGFKVLKIACTLMQIRPAVDDIVSKTMPNAVVLFGSASRGEDTEKSDIDLFVQAKRKDFDFSRIEKTLNRRISMTFEPDLKKVSPELLNNLANGITIYGFLEVAA